MFPKPSYNLTYSILQLSLCNLWIFVLLPPFSELRKCSKVKNFCCCKVWWERQQQQQEKDPKPLHFFIFFAVQLLLRRNEVKVVENHTKKSHSTLRAKRATFTVDKSSLKMPKMVNFSVILENWSLRSNSVTRQVNLNRTKFGEKCQNWKILMRQLC